MPIDLNEGVLAVRKVRYMYFPTLIFTRSHEWNEK